MKTLLSIFVVALLSISSLFAQADNAFVSNWTWPIGGWFASEKAPDGYTRLEAAADTVSVNFDASNANFDAEWNRAGTTAFEITKKLGLAASDKGANDFVGSFKAYYDEDNLYILLKYDDDDVTGNESVEIAIAPYLTVDATVVTAYPGAWYGRYVEFGGYKAAFNKTSFLSAFIVAHNASGAGAMDFSNSGALYKDNLFIKDYTAIGSKTVKQIYTISFLTLQGTARPLFNLPIWAALNGTKGISFDLKVNDVDTDDAFNTDATPAQKPVEYWWNTTNNNCWMSTAYAGFLKKRSTLVGVKEVNAENSIFGQISNNTINLKSAAKVNVFNASGSRVMSIENTNQINLNTLNKGLYVIRVNNETLKFMR